ncbi:hypothetical protein M501DRAFT_758719 [Patellaria atrata CBS 101060]|uniref:F-box domain-containing protein n=1 Tax=Patellaria atrata CBS 101060 TaxID=1346257 RepID=A0A9P4VSZ1_9PEZI|nr:hypothetical protein M501DRAFT_758719 [Patellaria atrata CBS 101060]
MFYTSVNCPVACIELPISFLQDTNLLFRLFPSLDISFHKRHAQPKGCLYLGSRTLNMPVILKLPNELLDRTCSYVSSTSDINTLRLTCKLLEANASCRLKLQHL